MQCYNCHALVNGIATNLENNVASKKMPAARHQQNQHLKQLFGTVKRALLAQFGLILLSALIAMILKPVVAIAIIIGGFVSLLPNAYFAGRVLLMPAPLNAYKRLQQLYAAEAIKLMLSALLFGLVFSRLKQVPPAWVLVGFLIAHVGYLVTLVRLQPKPVVLHKHRNDA